MSLLDAAMEEFTIINRTTVDDGYGGTKDAWSDGITIQAVAVLNTQTEMVIAQAQGTKAVYNLTTRKNINLQYHEVLRRERDKKIFRVTSDGDDNRTPDAARLNMRQVTCEEWELT